MRGVFLALAALIAWLPCEAGAQPKPLRFQGSFEITAKAGACPKYNPVGQRGLARLRPRVANTNNGAGASFVRYGERTAKGYRLAAGSFAAQLKPAQTVYTDDEWAPDPGTPKVKFSQVLAVPAGAISLQTKTLKITGTIVGFDLMPACNVTFKMTLSRFVDLVASASAARGQTLAVVCAACHRFGQNDGHLIGPNLYGVVNRPIASAPGFSYSTALTTFAPGKTWSYDELDQWLSGPQARVPGTLMTFPGYSTNRAARTSSPTPGRFQPTQRRSL